MFVISTVVCVQALSRLHADCVCVLCSLCARCDWQVLLHRCCSSESNQLGYLWSGNPEGGVSLFSLISLFFSLCLADHPSLKKVVEPFWSPFSLVSCSEEFGNSSLDTSALTLLFAFNSKPSFSGAT
ncbi:hypothetical protein ATANTOWER_023783 [Ataeniobius toweri]|uniref:Secreted protein n=1 Tax=Ataeniobius toweri TaxID=208326 RepID=A0ABU7B893_9TELE|nr:hypothetical protein [Ataeniobius toweri]